MHPHPLRNGSIRRTLLYLRGFHAIGNIRLPSMANFMLTHKLITHPEAGDRFFFVMLKIKLSYLTNKRQICVAINLKF